ncbi:DUF4294 domain-containing protein [Aureibaculum sp. 2210JD6-5]|uniref:DUF4294 domain-containing protein n=1 Tax=Aureibaculum sp. 2210JD6-5 TaxID=3103957 RepID=UPI002AADC972|nr:DUF4294 domain-containing protein [Aureibaculum sp. 2210JD6-5]MDY7395299.1 DUF4294 domain-containing protein [Aureibaculum sp. 2210JD6-5]
MKKILIILFLCSSFFTIAQIVKKDTIIDDKILIEGDSIMFTLDDVMVLSKLKFNSTKEQRYYYWYWKKVHNAYPFAKLAAERLLQLNAQLEKIKSTRKRKKHIKKMQKFMEDEFTDKLKKMTRTEGRILIKLIHRQTGLTTFELIKEYRSGWKAFWYNTTAGLFKLSLKSEYHPESEAIDFLIEDILQRSFVQGKLERQKARLAIDYLELVPKYKNIDIVEVVNNRDK